MNNRSALNATQRSEHLTRMAERELDIIVIGGGVTGCGIALDAVSRGLSVGLVEQRDYAAGTSSRSSKMFHGGLRYLEQLRFRLVREALAERNLMLNDLCPHLVQPAPFLYPLQHRFWERIYVGAGILIYDLLAALGRNPLPHHRHLSKKGALEIAPALDQTGLVGAIQYWDTVVDDARHTMTLARTAASRGALLASSTRVTEFVERDGRIGGVIVRDLEGGSNVTIPAKTVISAAGVWTDDIQALAGESDVDVVASKGVHLVVGKSAIESTTGLILRTNDSVLFVIPWGEHWIVGTTDTSWELHRAHPAASAADVEYLLEWVNTVLATPLDKNDIIGVYAGLRPLLTGESDATSRLSREHAVLQTPTGLISVAGGKYTTYRVMARDAVDAATRLLPFPVPESASHTIPLVGRERTNDISAMIAVRADLAEPVGESRYLRADIVYAATHEGALHLDDVLTRRTRISIETRDRGVTVAEDVADLMGEVMGWDSATREREVAHYLARVAAERDSQTRVDDETADAARMGAPDVRLGSVD